jgi:hypothetical protein
MVRPENLGPYHVSNFSPSNIACTIPLGISQNELNITKIKDTEKE